MKLQRFVTDATAELVPTFSICRICPRQAKEIYWNHPEPRQRMQDMHLLAASFPSWSDYFFNRASKASMTLSPTSFVPLDPPRSFVLRPSSNTFATAFSIRSASAPRPSEYRSIIAAERMVPIGLAIPCPAMSGADPACQLTFRRYRFVVWDTNTPWILCPSA